jgi:hypothetical protein
VAGSIRHAAAIGELVGHGSLPGSITSYLDELQRWLEVTEGHREQPRPLRPVYVGTDAGHALARWERMEAWRERASSMGVLVT